MMSGDDPNPIVFKNKKIKIRRPEHSLNPNTLHPITSHFCLTPLPPLPPIPPQTGRHIWITSYEGYHQR